MKKLAAISLLLLLLFNFIGYRFLINALQSKAEKQLVAKLDNNEYNDDDLVTITVPLSMPYLTDSKNFERKDGEITLNGKIYHYVKQKIYQGNLILKCLPDEQKMHLQNAKNEFFQLANDIQSASSSKKSNGTSDIVKLVIGSVYDKLQNSSFDFYSARINKPSFNIAFSFALQKGNGVTPEQPPQA